MMLSSSLVSGSERKFTVAFAVAVLPSPAGTKDSALEVASAAGVAVGAGVAVAAGVTAVAAFDVAAVVPDVVAPVAAFPTTCAGIAGSEEDVEEAADVVPATVTVPAFTAVVWFALPPTVVVVESLSVREEIVLAPPHAVSESADTHAVRTSAALICLFIRKSPFKMHAINRACRDASSCAPQTRACKRAKAGTDIPLHGSCSMEIVGFEPMTS